MSNYVRRAILPEVGEIVDADVVVDANDNEEQTRLNGPEDVLSGDVTATVSGDPALYAVSNQLKSVHKQTIDNPIASPLTTWGENWGTDVKISGDGLRIVAGIPGAIVSATNAAGSVGVFSRSGETWTLEQTIDNPNPADSEYFGTTVAIDHTGTRIAVSAPRADILALAEGRVYVFSRTGTTWTLEQELPSVDFGVATNGPEDEFGSGGLSFDQDATKIVIGSPRHSNGFSSSLQYGAMHTYTRSGTTWTAQTQFVNPFSSPGVDDFFGSGATMSSDGSTIVCQTPRRTINGGTYAGQLTTFRWVDATSRWVFVNNSHNPVVAVAGSALAATYSLFGYSPALSETGSIVLCGSPFFSSLGGTQNGGMHLFMAEAGPAFGPQYVDGDSYPFAAGTTALACSSVATSGDARFVVGGCPKISDTYTWEGKVIEYKREGRKLVPQGLIDAPILANSFQHFGEWVDVSDDGVYWVASIHNWTGAGASEEGKVAVFKREKETTTITLPNLDVGSKVIRTK